MQATNSRSIALGNASVSSGQNAVAMGSGSRATNTSAVTIGGLDTASGTTSIAIGNTAAATGTSAVAVGSQLAARQSSAMAFGQFATADAANAITLGMGFGATATDRLINTRPNNMAIGFRDGTGAGSSVANFPALSVNAQNVGIGIENPTARSVAEWCVSKMKLHGIPLSNITTHRFISPGRKNDVSLEAENQIKEKILLHLPS